MTKKKAAKLDLGVSIAVSRETGEIQAVYFRVRKGKAADVVEKEDGTVFLNYNKKGELLGVEMLAPCKTTVLDRIARKEPTYLRPVAKKFFRDNCPSGMVLAAG